MGHFWPTLPFLVPASQGVPLWWYIGWWIFQIVVMGFIIWLVTRWAVRIDRMMNVTPESKSTTDDTGRPLNS